MSSQGSSHRRRIAESQRRRQQEKEDSSDSGDDSSAAPVGSDSDQEEDDESLLGNISGSDNDFDLGIIHSPQTGRKLKGKELHKEQLKRSKKAKAAKAASKTPKRRSKKKASRPKVPEAHAFQPRSQAERSTLGELHQNRPQLHKDPNRSPSGHSMSSNTRSRGNKTQQLATERKEKEELEKKNEQLQKELDEAKKKAVTKSSTPSMKWKINAELLKTARYITKRALFRVLKFFADQEDIDWGARFVLELMPNYNAEDHDYHSSWIATYGQAVKTAILQQNSYVQSRIKEAADDLYGDTQQLPPYQAILRCAKREVDLENADDLKVFTWYWETLAAKFAGNDWGPKQKYYSKMSKQLLRGQYHGKKKLWSVSNEAMIAVIYESCVEKWLACKEWFENHPNEKKLPKRDKDNPDLAFLQGKYTDQNGGQQMYGGWTDAGVARYNAICEEILAARRVENDTPGAGREKTNYLQVEADFLVILREKRGYVSLSAEEERKRKRQPDAQPQQARTKAVRVEESDDEE